MSRTPTYLHFGQFHRFSTHAHTPRYHDQAPAHAPVMSISPFPHLIVFRNSFIRTLSHYLCTSILRSSLTFIQKSLFCVSFPCFISLIRVLLFRFPSLFIHSLSFYLSFSFCYEALCRVSFLWVVFCYAHLPVCLVRCLFPL
ncbi:hypothetical protein BJ165DRAFT_1503022 [Panaeolus papilionaceus]|nr:hypothetical protein BJ165DRAFT_1503022 [Panaeolus papilionaceus]